MDREGLLTYKCPVKDCDYEAKSLTMLRLHVKKEHLIESLRVCPFCKRVFKNSDGLRMHCAFHFDYLNHAILF
jgi:hypothetical protein